MIGYTVDVAHGRTIREIVTFLLIAFGLDVRAWVLILAHSSIKWSVVAPMVAKAVWQNIRHNASVGEEKELGNEIFPDLDARSADV